MTYQIVITRENKLNLLFQKLKNNVKSLNLYSPKNFVDIEKTFNIHKFNCNNIFKIKNNSDLVYFVCSVNNKDQIILHSLVKEFDSSLEEIESKSKSKSINIYLKYLLGLFLFFINLDFILVLLFYIINYKKFENSNQEKILNLVSFLAGVIGILSLTLIGLKLPFANLNPIINFPINIFFYFDNIIIKLGLAILIIIISKTITDRLIFTNSSQNNQEYQNINQLKI